MIIKPNIFPENKEWIEVISTKEVFEEKITQWITDYKNGILFKEDVTNVAKKVAEYRSTPFLVDEIKQRLN